MVVVVVVAVLLLLPQLLLPTPAPALPWLLLPLLLHTAGTRPPSQWKKVTGMSAQEAGSASTPKFSVFGLKGRPEI